MGTEHLRFLLHVEQPLRERSARRTTSRATRPLSSQSGRHRPCPDGDHRLLPLGGRWASRPSSVWGTSRTSTRTNLLTFFRAGRQHAHHRASTARTLKDRPGRVCRGGPRRVVEEEAGPWCSRPGRQRSPGLQGRASSHTGALARQRPSKIYDGCAPAIGSQFVRGLAAPRRCSSSRAGALPILPTPKGDKHRHHHRCRRLRRPCCLDAVVEQRPVP